MYFIVFTIYVVRHCIILTILQKHTPTRRPDRAGTSFHSSQFYREELALTGFLEDA